MMEIAGSGNAGVLGRVLPGPRTPDRASDSRPSGSGSSEDQVALSSRARDLQWLKALAEEPDAHRAARIEQIRQAVEAGAYLVRSRAVADAMIRHLATEITG